MTNPSLLDQWDVTTSMPSIPEKTYIGRRWPAPQGLERGRPEVTVIADGKERPLKSFERHSPDGFEWGYGGSGPSELALALLADHLGYEPPATLYHQYKAQVISRLRHDGWSLGSSDIAAWLAANLAGGRR